MLLRYHIFQINIFLSRIKAGAAHIAFSASSRTAVRDFYTAALTAGGRPHGSPACRNEDNGYFNAAVLDFDGNSVEVVYREDSDDQEAASTADRSRVLEWRKSVAESLSGADHRTTVSVKSAARTVKALTAVTPSVASSHQGRSVSSESVISIPRSSPPRNVSSPVIMAPERQASGDASAKTIIGTLLGAAAGAAVAYAMCKGEQDSAREEAEAYANHAKRLLAPPPAPAPPTAVPDYPQQPPHQQQRIEYEASYAPRATHRNFSTTESVYSTPSHHGAVRAIEAPPARSYQSPSYQSVAPSRANTEFQHGVEYITAGSVTSVSRAPTERSRRATTTVMAPARSTAGRSSHSTLISDFVPPSEAPRAAPTSEDGARSVASHRSSKSKSEPKPTSKAPSAVSAAKSSHSSSSKHTSTTVKKSKAPSLIGSLLGRDAIVEEPEALDVPLPPSTIVDDLDLDNVTVVPEDSISCVGTSRSRRSHHSSHHSHHSKKGSSSHHSSHSHRSRRDSAHDEAEESSDTDPAAYEEARSHHSRHSSRSHKSTSSKHSRPSVARSKTHDETIVIRPTSIEEVESDTSTIKPSRRHSSDSRRGSVASLPIRAITKSMVDGGSSSRRSVATYAG